MIRSLRKYLVVLGMLVMLVSVFPVMAQAAASKKSFSLNSVTGITQTDAKISSVITMSGTSKFTKAWFTIGTSTNNMVKNAKMDNFSITGKKLTSSFLMSKYGRTLKPSTKYYYRIYVVANGTTYASPVGNFTTKAKQTTTTKTTPTTITFPLTTSKQWYCSTYSTHGGKNSAAYCAIDIRLKNGKDCTGNKVYAMSNGKVVGQDKSNGQVTIRFSTPLTTTNGVTYSAWYATYAHMKTTYVALGDSVKAGQTIGLVGAKGNASGPHLHLSISNAEKGKWYLTGDDNRSMAISPYYICGFVTASGGSTSWLYRDLKGSAVTARLINWKPRK